MRSLRDGLRTLLSGERCVHMMTVHEPVAMRIAYGLGCEVGLMGGSLASLAVLGAPDLILITLTELVEQVRRCTRVVEAVPLVVDGDHGYGNALNVMRTIAELDAAGAAAVSIEDTLLPRAFGSSDDPQLLKLEEGLGKLKAAVAARGESGPLVFGRSSAATAIGLDDAVKRFTAYGTAGVDALMIPSVRSREELDRISAATHLPLVVGGIPEAMCDHTYLASRRVRLWSSGHHTVNVAVQALYDAMKSVHEGTLASNLSGAAKKELMGVLTGSADCSTRMRKFLV